MRPGTPRHVAAILASVGLLAPVAAGDTETSWGVGLTAGYDSNPLLVARDGPSGAFSQLRLDGGLTRYLGETSSSALFMDGHAVTRTDESPTSDAGYDSGRARVGAAFSPRWGGRRLMISAGGRAFAYDGTFTDRATGEVYEAGVVPPTDPPTTVAIPDRIDFESVGAFLNLRWKQSRRLKWSVETEWDRVDYVEDYGDTTDLDPLDYRAFTVRPGASFRLGDVATLGLQVALTDLDYDDRPALDKSGAEVPGTTRTYRYTQYRLSLGVVPAERWHLDVFLASGGRDDTFADYYDSVSRSGLVSLARALGRSSNLRLVASVRDVEYDHATVSGDPVDEIRARDERSFAGRFDRGFGPHLRWYVEGGREDSDSRDPVFSYDRDWMLTGIHYGR
jgi:hypothetical protein